MKIMYLFPAHHPAQTMTAAPVKTRESITTSTRNQILATLKHVQTCQTRTNTVHGWVFLCKNEDAVHALVGLS